MGLNIKNINNVKKLIPIFKLETSIHFKKYVKKLFLTGMTGVFLITASGCTTVNAIDHSNKISNDNNQIHNINNINNNVFFDKLIKYSDNLNKSIVLTSEGKINIVDSNETYKSGEIYYDKPSTKSNFENLNINIDYFENKDKNNESKYLKDIQIISNIFLGKEELTKQKFVNWIVWKNNFNKDNSVKINDDNHYKEFLNKRNSFNLMDNSINIINYKDDFLFHFSIQIKIYQL